MRMSRPASLVALFAVSMLLFAPAAPVMAQDYFIPGQQRPAQPAPTPRPPAPRPGPTAVTPPARPQPAVQPTGPSSDGTGPQVEVALPPVPELPPLPRSSSPPTAVIGVIGVPEVMRASSAAQQVDRVIGERREKLNEDAQKEQAAWRELQQQLAAQSATMSPEQKRTRERELQDRITNAQKLFRDRTKVIQDAAQVGVGQIERTLVAVIRQVAESHGMNLVLHRAQVALNVNEFDITEQVGEQLNKILPQVSIPADGVAPVTASAPNPVPGPVAPGPRK
jgi:Skp family chaperone for outer membrane proteins